MVNGEMLLGDSSQADSLRVYDENEASGFSWAIPSARG